jgi:hypothetical protein
MFCKRTIALIALVSDIKAEHIGEDTCAGREDSCEIECLKFYPEFPSIHGPKFNPNFKPRSRPKAH